MSGAYEIYYYLRGSEVYLYSILDKEYSKLPQDLYGTGWLELLTGRSKIAYVL